MPCCCYILFSPSRDRYYVGYTCEDVVVRLKKHNTNHKGFTGKTGDWKIVCLETFELKELAAAREKQIKAWKSIVDYKLDAEEMEAFNKSAEAVRSMNAVLDTLVA